MATPMRMELSCGAADTVALGLDWLPISTSHT